MDRFVLLTMGKRNCSARKTRAICVSKFKRLRTDLRNSAGCLSIDEKIAPYSAEYGANKTVEFFVGTDLIPIG